VRVELESLAGLALVVDEPRVIAEAVRRPLWKRALSVTAGVLVGAVAAGYAAWTLKPAPHEVTRFTVTLPEGQSFSNMARQVVALSPDGTTLVYAAYQRLFLRAMASLDPREIAGSSDAGPVQAVAFSPDGLSVAYWTASDNRLKRLAINGGAAVTVCAATGVSGMSWDEDGIVFGQPGKGIVRVASAGGVPEVIAPVDSTEMASMPQLLPGGKAVLFSVKKASDEWDNGRVVVQPLGGERRNLIEGAAAGPVPSDWASGVCTVGRSARRSIRHSNADGRGRAGSYPRGRAAD
jgi:eukaryotic-like serine/threonine-protein kinase